MSHGAALSSAFAKLRRAEVHLQELRAYVESEAFQNQSQLRLRAEFNPGSGFHIVRIAAVPDLTTLAEQTSLIVGDVANNLRCALDHLAWSLACAHTGGTPKKPSQVKFRICEASPTGTHCNKPDFLAASDWSLIRQYQPCLGINGRSDGWSGEYVHELILLQELNNSDKHKTLTEILFTPNRLALRPTRTTVPPWIVKTADGGFNFAPEHVLDPDPDFDMPTFDHATFEASVGAEVGRFRASAWRAQPTIEDVGLATPQVTLAEHRPAVDTLERLRKFVQLVLGAFL